jgi:hypothetical protein
MKSIAAAAVLVAPAAGKVRVVSWNAYGHHGHYGQFFSSNDVRASNIVLLQEAAGSKLGAAKAGGWKSTNSEKGLVTMWDAKKFTQVGKNECGNVPGSGKDHKGNKNRSGTACTIALKSKKGIVLVTNVHAGHNGKPSNLDKKGAAKALDAVKHHQQTYAKKYLKGKAAGLVIAGGDHNELGLYLTTHNTNTLMGPTQFNGKFGKTHHNGAIDKLFASRSGNGKTLKAFGSDHKAVMATLY